MKFILKRTVKYYEHFTIEAESFDDAMEQYFDGVVDDDDWIDSQLGEDTELTSIENEETREEKDVDPDTQEFV